MFIPEKSVHETLKDARAILAERGLAKSVLVDADGHVCLRGAINAAITGSPGHPNLALRRLVVDCEMAMGFDGQFQFHREDLRSAPNWNNAPWRTLEEVLERFDQAIEATAPVPVPAAPSPEPIAA